MSLLLQLLTQFLRCLALLCKKDGFKAIVAQNLLLTQQLIILTRGRKRATSVSPMYRNWLAFLSLFLPVRRLRQSALLFRPATLLRFRDFLTKQKYGSLFSPMKRRKPGPKGPSPEIITAVVEFKRRNPSCGYPRIAQQISDAFEGFVLFLRLRPGFPQLRPQMALCSSYSEFCYQIWHVSDPYEFCLKTS